MGKVGNIILSVFVWIFAAAGIIACVASIHFYNAKTANLVSVKVFSPKDKCLLTDSVIAEILSKEIKSTEKKSLRNLKDTIFTNKLSKIESIKSVQVSSMQNGNILIEIIQKDPVARICMKDKKYWFLTLDGNIFRSLYDYSKYNYLHINGLDYKDFNITNNKINNVCGLLSYMESEENQFLRSITDTIFVNKKGSMTLKTTLGNQMIVVGDKNNLDIKSYNLRVFYEAMKDKDLSEYESFNIQYENQVVAKTTKK